MKNSKDEGYDFLKKKRHNEKLFKQENLNIPDFLQDKNTEKNKEFNFLSILEDKIEALKSFGVQKGNEKSKLRFKNY